MAGLGSRNRRRRGSQWSAGVEELHPGVKSQILNLRTMKTSKHIIKTALFAATLSFASCSDMLLDEIPLDFYTPENPFITHAHFTSDLYSIIVHMSRTIFYDMNVV